MANSESRDHNRSCSMTPTKDTAAKSTVRASDATGDDAELKAMSMMLHVVLSPRHSSHASYFARMFSSGSGCPSHPTHTVAMPPHRLHRSFVCFPFGTPMQSLHRVWSPSHTSHSSYISPQKFLPALGTSLHRYAPKWLHGTGPLPGASPWVLRAGSEVRGVAGRPRASRQQGVPSLRPWWHGLYDSIGEHAMLPPFLSRHSSPGASQLFRIWHPEQVELSPPQTPHQSSFVLSFVSPLHPKQSTFSPKHTPHLSSDDNGQSPSRITECL
mmetsp:Transcript_17758/g.40991  ORF Transcript_17758/g.40991 Transcript_17758/m.40991 type:complete len:270 (+) Transcript_17758:139-948(+)